MILWPGDLDFWEQRQEYETFSSLWRRPDPRIFSEQDVADYEVGGMGMV